MKSRPGGDRYDDPSVFSESYLKNAFWPNIFVGASFQILDNQQVACGFKLDSAEILNQNPIFETPMKKHMSREKLY